MQTSLKHKKQFFTLQFIKTVLTEKEMYAITCYVYNRNLLKIKNKTLSSNCSKSELCCYMKMDKGLSPQHWWLIYNPITDEHKNSMLNEQ